MEIIRHDASVFYIAELIEPELCQRILKTYDQDECKREGRTIEGGGECSLRRDVKVSTDVEITRSGIWRDSFVQVDRAVNSALKSLAKLVPVLQVWPLQWTGYKIQHYKKGVGHFKWHFDAVGPTTWDRQMAMVIYLNSVEDGGETCFYAQELRIKPVVGAALLFPTFWTHTHCGEVPRSEDKFIISSFISFSMPGAPQAGRLC